MKEEEIQRIYASLQNHLGTIVDKENPKSLPLSLIAATALAGSIAASLNISSGFLKNDWLESCSTIFDEFHGQMSEFMQYKDFVESMYEANSDGD